METKLGRISNVRFGHGGYQDTQIGISFTLEGQGWGVSDFKGDWDAELIEHTEHCKWTEINRDKNYADTVRYLSQLLKDAKKDTVDELKGVPIEVTFEGNILKSWRILTEVL